MAQTCNYLNRPGNVVCSAVATHRNWTGKFWFPLCADHALKVHRDTRGKSNPTPMPGTVLQEKAIFPVPAPSAADTDAPAAAPRSAISDEQLRQLRLFREQLQSQPDQGSL